MSPARFAKAKASEEEEEEEEEQISLVLEARARGTVSVCLKVVFQGRESDAAVAPFSSPG